MSHFRSFLFLQGPHGPFFKELGTALREKGHDVHRVHFNMGDVCDWPGKGSHVFLWRPRNWTVWLESFVKKQRVTDLVLYGDCRFFHKEAISFFKKRHVRVHIFEEGYIRPYWVTYERDGVNGYSSLLQKTQKKLPSFPKKEPEFSNDLGKTTGNIFYYCLRYYAPQFLGFYIFPFFRTHRAVGFFYESLLWLKRLTLLPFIQEKANKLTQEVTDSQKTYFLLPLQLDGDYQIRVHSPFSSMLDALWKIMESFAHHSLKEDIIVIKNHPLDNGVVNFQKHITRMARDLSLEERVIYIDGGDFHSLLRHAKAMVVVNSTSGFQAIRHGIPTKVLGDAIYNIPGLAASQTLNQFWKKQDSVNLKEYQKVRNLLLHTCQVNGSFYTSKGRRLLCEKLVDMLSDEGI